MVSVYCEAILRCAFSNGVDPEGVRTSSPQTCVDHLAAQQLVYLVRLVGHNLADVSLELATGSLQGDLNLTALIDIGVEDDVVEVEVEDAT